MRARRDDGFGCTRPSAGLIEERGPLRCSGRELRAVPPAATRNRSRAFKRPGLRLEIRTTLGFFDYEQVVESPLAASLVRSSRQQDQELGRMHQRFPRSCRHDAVSAGGG